MGDAERSSEDAAPAIGAERIGLKAGFLAALATALWGGNSVSIKIGLEGMPPVAMAGVRFALGALTVTAGALFSGISIRVPAARWRGLGGLGLLFCVQIVLLTAFSVFSRSNYSMEKSNSDYYVANKTDTAPPA